MKAYKKPNLVGYFEEKAALPALAAAFAAGVTAGLRVGPRDIHSGQRRFLNIQAEAAIRK